MHLDLNILLGACAWPEIILHGFYSSSWASEAIQGCLCSSHHSKSRRLGGYTPEETDIAMPYSAELCLHAGMYSIGPRNTQEGDSLKVVSDQLVDQNYMQLLIIA